MAQLIADIRADAEYKKFKRILQTTQERLDFEVIVEEARSLHQSRVVRSLYGKKAYSPKNVLDASAQEVANRSRLVELRLRLASELSILEQALSLAKKYVSTEYADDLAEFKTRDQRIAFVDRVFRAAIEYHNEGQQVVETLDFLIQDIDKASYHISTMKEILSLLTEKRGRVN